MRTYLIDPEGNELIVDLTKTIRHSSELVEFEYSTLSENKRVDTRRVFVRRLAGQYFTSSDNIHWKKLARQHLPTELLNIDRVFKVYYGFKPSGLNSGAAGELLSQMPGKVVKIMVKEGEQVEVGQTLIILEAMKMENEIKAGTSGVVKAIHVNEGQALDSGYLMMEVE